MRVTATVLGLSTLAANLANRERRATAAAVDALNKVGGEVFGESQRRVPVDTGNLKGSGRIEAATPGELNVTLSYGGTASAYAIIVHETHRTRRKFLEEPARNASRRLTTEVAEAVRRALR